MEIKVKRGRPLKGKNKLVPCWVFVRQEHYRKVQKLITELVKQFR